jgi:hypothetical protein
MKAARRHLRQGAAPGPDQGVRPIVIGLRQVDGQFTGPLRPSHRVDSDLSADKQAGHVNACGNKSLKHVSLHETRADGDDSACGLKRKENHHAAKVHELRGRSQVAYGFASRLSLAKHFSLRANQPSLAYSTGCCGRSWEGCALPLCMRLGVEFKRCGFRSGGF